MVEWLLGNISYLGIVLILILTGCGLPVPEEVIIVAAGVASSSGSLEPGWAFAACLLGALIGDCVMYAIGYHFGHGLAKRHPRFAHLLHVDREAEIEDMMRRHGFKVFFISRFMVGVRSPIYLTAGILRISFQRFFLTDLFCATSVVGTFFWLSHWHGERLLKWIMRLDMAVTATVVAAIAIVGIYFWRRRRRNALATQAALVAEALSLQDDSPSESNGKIPVKSETDQPSTGAEPSQNGTAASRQQSLV
jgi:membrane protein DedA with SNARE-associated domain